MFFFSQRIYECALCVAEIKYKVLGIFIDLRYDVKLLHCSIQPQITSHILLV